MLLDDSWLVLLLADVKADHHRRDQHKLAPLRTNQEQRRRGQSGSLACWKCNFTEQDCLLMAVILFQTQGRSEGSFLSKAEELSGM